jgi:transcriptional regulator with XRE-family HTH domain
MSHFSTALKCAIEKSNLQQSEIADSLKMNQSQFSGYCNGRRSIGASVVTKIIGEFPDHIQSDLVRSYLLDRLGPEALQRVEIIARTDRVAENEPDGLASLPENVRQSLRYIGSRCTEQPVLDLVVDLCRLLRGNK